MKRTLTLASALTLGLSVAVWAGQDGGDARAAIDEPQERHADAGMFAPDPGGLIAWRNSRYRLRAGDIVALDFHEAAELSQTLAVRTDGHVTLKQVGPVPVAGRTLPELADLVRAAYAAIVRDPIVTVDLKKFATPSFVAGGQVVRPGTYRLHAPTTLTQALARAGGLRSRTTHSTVWLFRRVSHEFVEARRLDLNTIRERGETVQIRPEDVLYVPRSARSTFERFIPVPGAGLPAGAGRLAGAQP
jgi:polysaccharide export outer membrane protein